MQGDRGALRLVASASQQFNTAGLFGDISFAEQMAGIAALFQLGSA